MKRIIISALLASTSIACAHAGDALDTEQKKISYTLGAQLAQRMPPSAGKLDVDAVTAAVRDVLSGQELKLSQPEMVAVMDGLRAKVLAERQKAADVNLKEGQDFLASNAKKEGIKTLESGVQYKVVTKGKGKTPKATDKVLAHYEGRLINGKVFDSSIKRGQPATFPVNAVIKGWQEVLQKMNEGDKWQVFIPSELAYGAQSPSPDIGPNSTLIFDIELIKIN